jgi:hypothetical protein
MYCNAPLCILSRHVSTASEESGIRKLLADYGMPCASNSNGREETTKKFHYKMMRTERNKMNYILIVSSKNYMTGKRDIFGCS